MPADPTLLARDPLRRPSVFDPAAATPENILARIERLPLSAWQIRTRIIVGTATFFDAFDALSIAYVLPAIVPLWKLGFADVSFLISSGYLGQLIGALIGGALAERFGRRPVVVAAVFWFGVFSIACGFAWSYPSLVVLRLLQGLGLGAEVPVAATYISELARAHGRGRFVLLFELVFPVGLLAAAILGRWIVPNLGWQYLFFRRRHPGLAGAGDDAQPAGVAALAGGPRPRRGSRTRHGVHRGAGERRNRRPPAGAAAGAKDARPAAAVLGRSVRRKISEPHAGDLDLLVRGLFRQLWPHHLAAHRLPDHVQAAARPGADLWPGGAGGGAHVEPGLCAADRPGRPPHLVRLQRSASARSVFCCCGGSARRRRSGCCCSRP